MVKINSNERMNIIEHGNCIRPHELDILVTTYSYAQMVLASWVETRHHGRAHLMKWCRIATHTKEKRIKTSSFATPNICENK